MVTIVFDYFYIELDGGLKSGFDLVFYQIDLVFTPFDLVFYCVGRWFSLCGGGGLASLWCDCHPLGVRTFATLLPCWDAACILFFVCYAYDFFLFLFRFGRSLLRLWP